MAYDGVKHDLYSRRCRNWCNMMQNLREEASRLDAIYTNESQSGSDPSFAGTYIATKQEHIDLVNCFRDLKKFFENQAVTTEDRSQWITPFTANNE